MRSFFLGFTIFSFFGMILLTTTGFGTPLGTSSEINKIDTLKISDSSAKTLMGLNLGIDGDITSMTLTFKNSIDDNTTLHVSLKDGNGVEIGIGSQIVSPASTTVNVPLSDSVTSAERDTLRTASITVT